MTGSVADRFLRWCFAAALRVSLLFSPRPAALLVRRVFAVGGAKTARSLARHAPDGVSAAVDERYGDEPDMVLDVYRPVSASGPFPLVLWVHGGGFVGGAKEELAGYFRLIASAGFVVAAPRYALAPEHRYPAPPRQMMQALAHLQSEADRLLIDAARIALAGDSAGAQIAAQVGALVSTPGYAAAVGVEPTIDRAQLRCLALACGPYDIGLARESSSAFVRVVFWAYSGERDHRPGSAFDSWSVTDHLTAAFPPALVTVGNADPLRPHSELLVEKLQALGVETESLFFPDDHSPPLGHEYQFDLDGDAGRLFLERLLAFLRRRL